MKYRYLLIACSLFASSMSAQAEGFTGYYMQRVVNGVLEKQVSCEVLVPYPDHVKVPHVITKADKFRDIFGNYIESGVILGGGFYVSAGWDPKVGCDDPDVPKPLPAPLNAIPKSAPVR